MTEIIIVNEQNIEIGVKDRSLLVPEDIYRVSALWLSNSVGDVLLARRSPTKEINPGLWGPAVAGTLDAGETYESNIIKETFEEIGLTITLGDITAGPLVRRVSSQSNYFGQWFFLKRDVSVNECVCAPHEVAEIAWFSESQLLEQLRDTPQKFVPGFGEWLPQLLAESGQ
ncbi:MAG: NUDIX domain-containing protein [Minisyncoccia bacterium]